MVTKCLGGRFAVVKLILSVRVVEIRIQCVTLYRLMHAIVDFVMFQVFAIFDVWCNSGRILVSYFHGLAALRALPGESRSSQRTTK